MARLAPDLFGTRTRAAWNGAQAQGEAQERLFEGVSRFLAQLAGQEPLLLVLEDLHWASRFDAAAAALPGADRR